MKKLKCKYCKKVFWPVRRQKFTCGQEQCQQKRKIIKESICKGQSQ
ncbi:MAG: hypothetical protein OXM55_04440 [Bdellovibrionales bacterium]|nr:hypothetical protein [Bdellovibrionales bacterium]